jgi:hypothetical protein
VNASPSKCERPAANRAARRTNLQRSSQSARILQAESLDDALTLKQKLRSAPPTQSQKVNDTVGPPELCAWRYGPGVCRFQARVPLYALKLARRSGARLVAWSVCGGYLRIFQERITPRRARALVTRYVEAFKRTQTGRVTVTNDVFSSHVEGQEREKVLPRVKDSGGSVRQVLPESAMR